MRIVQNAENSSVKKYKNVYSDLLEYWVRTVEWRVLCIINKDQKRTYMNKKNWCEVCLKKIREE